MARHADDRAIATAIRQRRLEKGLTQAQVGEPRFTSAYISLIECGHRRPSIDTLTFIAKRLDMDVEELLAGTPPGLEAQLELRLHEARKNLDAGAIDRARTEVALVSREAEVYGLGRVEARAYEVLARIAEQTDGYEAALECYRRAEHSWAGHPVHLRMETVAGLARCTRRLGDSHMAVHILDSYRRDLITLQQPSPDALMRTYSEMVYAYFAVGLPEKASEAARGALQLESQVDDPEEVACMHLTVARSLLFERQFTDALASVRRADEIYSAGGWKHKAIKARIAEGIVLAKKDDLERARDRLLSAIDLLVESPHRLDEAMTLNYLGRVTRRLGNISGAISYLERARPLMEDADLIDRAFNAREMGLCLSEIDCGVAETHLNEAIDLYRISRSADELAATHKALGDLFVLHGKKDLAIAALRDGLECIEDRLS